jgi:hypothetical protein
VLLFYPRPLRGQKEEEEEEEEEKRRKKKKKSATRQYAVAELEACCWRTLELWNQSFANPPQPKNHQNPKKMRSPRL